MRDPREAGSHMLARLLNKYNLTSPYDIVTLCPSMSAWKACTKAAVGIFWKHKLNEAARQKTS